MSKESMNDEEVQAVKELIEKLPPEDLEKAVGGLTKKQKKLLGAMGIVALTALTVGVIKKDDWFGGSEPPPASNKYYDYYNHHYLWKNTLKNGFKVIDGVIYRDTGIATSAFGDYVNDANKKYGSNAQYDRSGKNVFVSTGVRVEDLEK